jgi:hypothetical protein
MKGITDGEMARLIATGVLTILTIAVTCARERLGDSVASWENYGLGFLVALLVVTIAESVLYAFRRRPFAYLWKRLHH